MKLQKQDILYEDNHLIAINKMAGVPSQGDESGDMSAFEMVKSYIRDKYNKPGEIYLGLLHRIDRPVSGVLIYLAGFSNNSFSSPVYTLVSLESSFLTFSTSTATFSCG